MLREIIWLSYSKKEDLLICLVEKIGEESNKIIVLRLFESRIGQKVE
jgi:hypothetical protein